MQERHFGPVWFIPGENKGRYPFCHSVYIEGDGILIDPASDKKRLTALRNEPGVNAVWLSHWHEDHITHLDLFGDVPLWISAIDAPPLSNIEIFLDWYGFQNEEYRQYWRQAITEQFHFKPRTPQGFLRGGETLRLDSVTVDVISAPGHTPGNLAFFFREPAVLFLGDYDLTRFGPWYGDTFSSIEDTIASLRYLRQIPAKVWLAGHEQGLYEASPGALWDEFEKVIYSREAKLLAALDQPKSLEEIVGLWLIYGKPREPFAFFEFGERALASKHLESLQKRGLVCLEKGRFVRTADELSTYLQAHLCSGGSE